MFPDFINLGPLSVNAFGIMNALAYFACIMYMIKYRGRINISKEILWDAVFVVAIGAIVGGKLMYFIAERASLGATFAEQIKNFFLNFRYGFVFYGGFIVSVGALVIFLKKKKLPVLRTADFMIVALPLGHAIGRIGCFLVGCCHGRPWSGPLAVTFTNPQSEVARELLGVPLYPTQLFESGANLIIFLILHFMYSRRKHNGAMLCAYAAMYGAARFCIEFFRGDYRGALLGVSTSQFIGLGAVLAAGIFYFFFIKKGYYDK